MPRLARKDLASNFVHIMAQGINREYIFQEDQFKEKYWNILQEKIADYDIKVISNCIMDNHVHLVVYYKNIDELSLLMKRTNTSYAKWYNEHQNRVGYVFRDRYKTEQILDYHHLYSCINYVHNNPVKAGMVDRPEQYNYSSYKNFLSDEYILNSEISKLLNLSLEDIKEIFIKSMNQNFLNYRGDSPEKVIEKYLKEKNARDVKDIISKKNLKELVMLLKEKSNIGYGQIADLLGISRGTLYRIKK